MTTSRGSKEQRKEGTAFVSKAAAGGNDTLLESVRRGEFTQQITDPFRAYTGVRADGAWNIIAPPMNPNALLRMTTESSALKQCIEAVVTNVSGHGYRLEYIGPEGQNTSAAAMAEEKFIRDFMEHANDTCDMVTVRKRLRWDLEAMGNAYAEVARDAKGRVFAVWHVPGHLVRITEADRNPTRVEVTLPRVDGPTKVAVNKHFRRYVQIRANEKVYFKEFGDPRNIDPKTGAENNALAMSETATEIVHLQLYHAGSAYGLPRWANNIVALQGARQAELTNLDYFSDNAVPAMIVTVSGGSLTANSLRAIESHFTAIRGRAAQNRVVVIEAYGDEDGAGEDGRIQPPKVDIKSMADERPSDGMFLEYDKAQTDKLRSSFRLPPIFLGLSEDYTHATANTSYEVAEGQVFGPERVVEDSFINRTVLGGYGLKFWEVRSNPPRISNPELVLKALTTFEATGAMTPNVAIGIANELFDLDIEEIREDWGDFPFTVVKGLAARGALKGWESIVKEVEPPQAPPVAAPGAAGVKPLGKKPAAKPGAQKPAEKATKEAVGLAIRDALLELRTLARSSVGEGENVLA